MSAGEQSRGSLLKMSFANTSDLLLVKQASWTASARSRLESSFSLPPTTVKWFFRPSSVMAIVSGLMPAQSEKIRSLDPAGLLWNGRSLCSLTKALSFSTSLMSLSFSTSLVGGMALQAPKNNFSQWQLQWSTVKSDLLQNIFLITNCLTSWSRDCGPITLNLDMASA